MITKTTIKIMEALKEKIFAILENIRYVAIYADGKLICSERPGIENTSSSESDKYEELIVNPTLLKLVTQRGNIDCGGAEYVIIRYGSFYELVMPIKQGHVSVGMELNSDLIEVVAGIQSLINVKGISGS
jgi:hypothetical protein